MWGEAIIRFLGCPSYPTTGPARNQQPLLTAFVPPPLSANKTPRSKDNSLTTPACPSVSPPLSNS